MAPRSAALTRFAKYAWFVLGWNMLVILWGVFLRASKSGDGCGQHWLTCHGEVVPSAPELKTVIEFSHRISSAVDGIFVIALVIWAVRIWYRSRAALDRNIMISAVASLIFVLVEGLIGRGLVLTGNTAETLTPERPFWMTAHLINTLILLVFLTLTAWYSTHGKRLTRPMGVKSGSLIAVAALLFILVGVTGSIAALTHMVFPAGTFTEELVKDFSPTSHFLLRLRPIHPLLAIFTAVYLVFLTGWIRGRLGAGAGVMRWTNIISGLAIAQLAFGAATLLMSAPILMQLGHLLLADMIWLALIMLTLELKAGDEV